MRYPLTDRVPRSDILYDSGDGVTVRVRFIDLFDVENSLNTIAQDFG